MEHGTMGVTLEELTPGSQVKGLAGNGAATVVQARWHGLSALTVTFRDEGGRVAEQVLFRDDEAKLEKVAAGRAWSFDADGELFRLASEARRIELAWLFDPFLAVQTSNLEPLPHQIDGVYEHMLTRQPLRFLLADDPGAGKTIMAGLLIKELEIRGDVERCLVIAPGGLVEQWQDELSRRFGLHFEIFTRQAIEASQAGNPFAERPRWLARLDQLARDPDLQAKIAAVDWDLVVVDEAHKMSAHYYGNELKPTKRYKLGELLGAHSRHLLLMTATPHTGKEEDFHLFLALLDSDRFAGRTRDSTRQVDTNDLMRRVIKEKLVRFDGRPLFPDRYAYSPQFSLSDAEAALYVAVTDYVREEMNRVERMKAAGEGRRGAVVGFALTTLQRRLASSPEAIFRSLERRRKRLESRLREARLEARGRRALEDLGVTRAPEGVDFDELDDLEDDELTAEEREELEEEVVDAASAAESIAELQAEIDTLTRLEQQARTVRSSGTDKKWEELSGLLQGAPEIRQPDGSLRKLIVFTEHRDTLNYLVERLGTLLGRPEAIVAIHGGVKREERRKIEEAFTQDKDVWILVATDAAGEGLNLQRAHLVINYDLPWNPNRIEQRFGRVHRIGQTEVCHLWNLVARDTREGEVFHRLFEKLDQQRKDLGDQVFDVLGPAFGERSLRDLLIEAIRFGDRPEVKARLEQVVDDAAGPRVKELVRERALASEVITNETIEHIKEEMERAEARRLQPQFVQAFFLETFRRFGGRAAEREPGRFEVTRVPGDLRRRDRQIGRGAVLLRSYERITFERELVRVDGKPLAELVAPGHPLLDALIDLVNERYGDLLRQGSVLVDEIDDGETPRVLVYLEHAIRDGVRVRDGDYRVVSRRFDFVELEAAGAVKLAGWAPYLDLRPLQNDERALIGSHLDEEWLGENMSERAEEYAISEAVPKHLAEVRRRTEARVERVRAAVKARLESEIRYWDHRANQLKEQELAGKKPRLNSGRARAMADELQDRLRLRTEELERERQLAPLPPRTVGAALVIPRGMLERLRGERADGAPERTVETEAIERAAVVAVMAAERQLNRDPTEMPKNNKGYDIESKTGTGDLLFIEVKGRIEGADTVTVTRSEIGVGLNKPDSFILALGSVPQAGGSSEVRYLRRPFDGMGPPHFASVSETFDFAKLWNLAKEPS
jgi:SNF2 family DNA or RNA helicase